MTQKVNPEGREADAALFACAKTVGTYLYRKKLATTITYVIKTIEILTCVHQHGLPSAFPVIISDAAEGN